MNNNYGYGGFPSSNSSNSSFQSFSSQYASTPTNNNSRFQRPRFAYAGPPSYPRPRSSASKPNPDPYSSNVQNSSYNDEYDQNSMANSSVDFPHGYEDSMSMRNNFGDTSLHLNDSLNMNQSRVSFDDSSQYITCSESFYQSPLPSNYSNYDSNNLSYGPSDRGGHSAISNINTLRQQEAYLNTNVGGSALYNANSIGIKSSNSVFQGLSGTFATSTKGSFGGNTRGRGIFSQNRGNARGRFHKKKPRGGSRWSNPMAPKSTWRCDVCSIQFTSQIPLDMHLRGSKHAKKLKSLSIYNCIQGQTAQIKEIEKPDGKKYYCELCDVIANSSLQLQMHLDGTKHKSKLTQSTENTEESKDKDILGNKTAKAKEEVNGKSNGGGGGGVRRPAPAEFSEPQPTKMTKFSCDICNVFVNSDVQLQQHLTSKKHQAKVEGKPIIKKRKVQKQDGESEQPMEQQSADANKKAETTSVIGVKTLSASFVRGENQL